MFPSSGKNVTSIQLEADGKHEVELCEAAAGFANIFSQYIAHLVVMSSPSFRYILKFYLKFLFLIQIFSKLLSVTEHLNRLTLIALRDLLLRVLLIYLYVLLNIFLI
jgi:hypothetical protein